MSKQIEYGWSDLSHTPIHKDLLPLVMRFISLAIENRNAKTILDLGCGNGSIAGALLPLGVSITGVDASRDGLLIASEAYPSIRFECASVYDNLAEQLGTFDVVISLDVVEHLYDPRSYVRTLSSLIAEGGIAILSTPYHGYLKNLALALTGGFDKHFTALWDHGHIKFWSQNTLRVLLSEANLTDIEFHRIGRIPQLARSLVAVITQ